MSKRRRHQGASLAREPFRVIVGCLWRMVAAGVLSASVILAAVTVLWGSQFMGWGMAVVPIPVAISTFLRGSRRLVVPAARALPNDRRLRFAARWAAVVLFVLGAWAITWAALGNASLGYLVIACGPLTVLVGTLGVWAGMSLDEWVLDDRAERLHGLAMWIVVLGVLGTVAIIIVALVLGRAIEVPPILMFLWGFAWWLLILLGDCSLIGALLWCLRHRAHYEEILARNLERDAAEQADFSRRREAMDGA